MAYPSSVCSTCSELTMSAPIKVAWITNFGVEWLPDLPPELARSPRQHPMTWQRVLLAELEKKRDVEIHVIVIRKTIDRDISFERNGTWFHVLKTRSGWRAPTFFWVETLLIRRVLNRIRPDLVHAWGTEAGAALVASRLGYPYLVTIQGLLGWYKELVSLSAYFRFNAGLESLSLRRARTVTTEATFAVRFLQEHYPHLQVHQAEHAPDWVFHQVQREPQIEPKRFLFVGTLEERKGVDLLLQALDQVRQTPFELIIVGGSPRSPFMQSLQKGVSQELWQRLTFREALSPAEIAAEMTKATILIMPTRADTSPNAVKEAAVAGLPVIASRLGGIPDYISDGKNGFLFRSGDLGDFIQALTRACNHAAFGRGIVDSDCLKQVRHYLSPALMEQRFSDLYCKLSEKGHVRS